MVRQPSFERDPCRAAWDSNRDLDRTAEHHESLRRLTEQDLVAQGPLTRQSVTSTATSSSNGSTSRPKSHLAPDYGYYPTELACSAMDSSGLGSAPKRSRQGNLLLCAISRSIVGPQFGTSRCCIRDNYCYYLTPRPRR